MFYLPFKQSNPKNMQKLSEARKGGLKRAGKDSTGWVCRSQWPADLRPLMGSALALGQDLKYQYGVFLSVLAKLFLGKKGFPKMSCSVLLLLQLYVVIPLCRGDGRLGFFAHRPQDTWIKNVRPRRSQSFNTVQFQVLWILCPPQLCLCVNTWSVRQVPYIEQRNGLKGA